MPALECPLCHGDGWTWIGHLPVERYEMCPECDGRGTVGCDAPHCYGPATHELPGGKHFVCDTHYAEWLAETEEA